MDAPAKSDNFDCRAFILRHGDGALVKHKSRQIIYQQGAPADSLFYILSGMVKVTVASEFGKEAVIEMLGAETFFGEGCLSARGQRGATIEATRISEIARFNLGLVHKALHSDAAFTRSFMSFMVERNEGNKERVADLIIHSGEERLVRMLLALAKEGSEPVPYSHETLANMIGTTRARVSMFLSMFRREGHVDYDENTPMRVHSSLRGAIARKKLRS